MVYRDSGQGRAKLIVELAILFAMVYVGIKAIPVYVQNYQLSDHIRQSAVEASANRLPAEAVQHEVVGYARSLGLPVSPENVQVSVTQYAVTITVSYSVPVDLKVYIWVLHFSPSTESRFL